MKFNGISKLIDALAVARDPRGRRALRRWRPCSLSSFRLVAALARLGVRPRTIVDGGANVGQFARAAAEFFPEATIYAMEPLPAAARAFRANLRDRPSVRLFETALGRRDGTLRFHPHAYSQSSSALPLPDEGRRKHAGQRQLAPIEVPVARLDTLLAGEAWAGPGLLKLDVQGSELEALEGAAGVLARCDYVLAETVFDAAYQGEPLFEEVHAYLRDRGYRFLQPLAFLDDDRGQIYQMDALFRRGAARETSPACEGVVTYGPGAESGRGTAPTVDTTP